MLFFPGTFRATRLETARYRSSGLKQDMVKITAANLLIVMFLQILKIVTVIKLGREMREFSMFRVTQPCNVEDSIPDFFRWCKDQSMHSWRGRESFLFG